MNYFSVDCYFCTTDRPGLGARPSTVLTREVVDLHEPLSGCADHPTGVDGPSASAKSILGMDCVFLVVCTTDCPSFKLGQY
jgi:hypothetical protein